MLKFLSGVVVGWTAARVLPPKPDGESPFRLPTSAEWRLLAQYAVRTIDEAKEKLEEIESDD